MRKIISALDQDQRDVLLELTDLGAATFSAGLIIALLQGLVNFVTAL